MVRHRRARLDMKYVWLPLLPIAVVAAAIALGAAGLLLDRHGAQGHHLPGDTYFGTHSGGGTVIIRVPTLGSSVWTISFTDVPCDGESENSTILTSVEVNSAVSDHPFVVSISHGPLMGTSITGSFPTPGEAVGRYSLRKASVSDPSEICESGSLTWTATTDKLFIDLVFTDVDCDGDADATDALKVLQHVAGLSVLQVEPCPDVGATVVLSQGGVTSVRVWGDADCDGDVDAVDTLKKLRHIAGLPVEQEEPCPDIGTVVQM